MPPAQCGFRAWAGPASPAVSAAPARARVSERFTMSSLAARLGEPVAIDLQAERGAEIGRRLARREHARHEDLEVLHDLGDRGVERQLERDLLLRLVHV